MVALGYLFLIFAVYLVVSSFFYKQGPETISILGAELKAQKKARRSEGFLDTVGRINAPVLEKLKMDKYYQRQLDRAGLTLRFHGFFTVKEIVALAAFVLVSLFGLETNIVFIAVLICFFLPDLWLAKKIKTNKERILRILPETVDLLGLCISAGLDFMGAVKWITQSKVQFGSALTDELSRVREEVNLGKSRKQALLDMKERLQIPEITSLVRSLLLSERLGVPISEGLKNFSEDNREQRFHRGERQARMAAIKVLFPLVFCILPVIGIIVVGPVILQFLEQGMGGF